MRNRQDIKNVKRDQKYFSATADRTNKKNFVRRGILRGGYRL